MEAAPHPWPALGVLLLRDGLVSKEELEEILTQQHDTRQQRVSGRRLGEILIQRGRVTPAQVAKLVAEQYELPFVDFTVADLDLRVATLLREEDARRFSALPVSQGPDGTYLLAIADPGTVLFSEELRGYLGSVPQFAVVGPDAIERAIDYVFSQPLVLEPATEVPHQRDDDAVVLDFPSAGAFTELFEELDSKVPRSDTSPLLGALLVRDGFLSESDLEAALAQQRISPDLRLGEILVDKGLVTQATVTRLLAEQYEMRFFDLGALDIDPKVATRLPEDIARRLVAVPIAEQIDGSLDVAISDPTRAAFSDDLHSALGVPLTIVMASPDAILALLDDLQAPAFAPMAAETVADVNAPVDEVTDEPSTSYEDVATDEAPTTDHLALVEPVAEVIEIFDSAEPESTDDAPLTTSRWRIVEPQADESTDLVEDDPSTADHAEGEHEPGAEADTPPATVTALLPWQDVTDLAAAAPPSAEEPSAADDRAVLDEDPGHAEEQPTPELEEALLDQARDSHDEGDRPAAELAVPNATDEEPTWASRLQLVDDLAQDDTADVETAPAHVFELPFMAAVDLSGDEVAEYDVSTDDASSLATEDAVAEATSIRDSEAGSGWFHTEPELDADAVEDTAEPAAGSDHDEALQATGNVEERWGFDTPLETDAIGAEAPGRLDSEDDALPPEPSAFEAAVAESELTEPVEVASEPDEVEPGDDLLPGLSQLPPFDVDEGARAVLGDLPAVGEPSRLTLAIDAAVDAGASTLHFSPVDDGFSVRARIDGVVSDVGTATPAERDAEVARLEAAELVRTYVASTERGEKATLFLREQAGRPATLDELVPEPATLEAFRSALEHPTGALLVCGPIGSGTTTTLYAAIREVVSPNSVVTTVEYPVELPLDGVDQIEVNSALGVTFASALRDVRFTDPDTIMVGDLLDLDTAALALRHAREGRLVLAGYQAPSAATATRRLAELGVEPTVLAASLGCVVSQRLLRTVCEHCRETYFASEAELELLRVEEDDKPVTLAHGTGCEHCGGSGYHGRTAVFEVLTMTDALRELVAAGSSPKKLQRASVSAGMRTVRLEATRLCLEGVTSAAELERVLGA